MLTQDLVNAINARNSMKDFGPGVEAKLAQVKATPGLQDRILTGDLTALKEFFELDRDVTVDITLIDRKIPDKDV